LLLCSSYLPLGVPNWTVFYIINTVPHQRVAEWAVELQPFEISFETTKVIKSKALAEFTTEWTDPLADEPLEVESMLPGEEAPGL
jgi:hypothetical protein